MKAGKIHSPVLLAVAFVSLLAISSEASAKQVNVYTERQQVFLADIFELFTQESGIDVEVLYIDKGLIERLDREGSASPADAVILTDVSRLEQLVERNLASRLDSEAVRNAVPEWLRDQQGRWTALTRRARLVYVRADADVELQNYEDLAAESIGQTVCMRSASHPYNNALFAAFLSHHGQDKTAAWMRGLKRNLARAPQGNDRAQIKAVAAGECRFGIGNSYYYFKMITGRDPAEQDAAAKVRWIAPVFSGGGTHMNVSGIAITRNAPNRDSAQALVDFMVGKQAQEIYAHANYELSVRSDARMPAELAAVAKISGDVLPLAAIGRNRSQAARIASEVGLAK